MSSPAVQARPALTHDDLDEALQSIQIPACPAVVADVMREAQKDDPDMRVLARVIASDVGMSAMAIKLANSALFRATSPVKSVSQAVNRLGISNVLSVVIAAALRSASASLPSELMDPFWNRAATLALSTAVIARCHMGVSAENAYTFALFHDAAIPVMMTHYPQYGAVYAAAQASGRPLVADELAHFPCSHPTVGWLLARNWGLPPVLAAAIRFHHEPDIFSKPDDSLTPEALGMMAVTLVAEHVLAECIGDTGGELDTGLAQQAMAYLGTSDQDLDDFRERVAAAIR